MQKVNDKPVSIGENLARYTFRVYDDASDPAVDNLGIRLVRFMQEFVDQPALLRCGPVFAQKIAITHDGTRWVMAAEAVADIVQGMGIQ